MQPAVSASSSGRPVPPGVGAAVWKVRGASAQGDGHLVRGTPCQDTFLAETITVRGGQRAAAEVPVYILAVADGAGSRRRSAQGASVAVGLAVEQASAVLASQGTPADAAAFKDLVADVFDATVEQFRQLVATFPGTDVDDYATTLNIVLICGSLIGIAAVGDGFTIARTDDRRFKVIDYEPKAAIGVETSGTTFLTSDDVGERRRVRATEDAGVSGILVSTDGMANTLLDAGYANRAPKPAADTVGDVMQYLGDADAATDGRLFDFLLDRDLADHTRDDKTILMAVRK
jgi:hypothetical protein